MFKEMSYDEMMMVDGGDMVAVVMGAAAGAMFIAVAPVLPVAITAGAVGYFVAGVISGGVGLAVNDAPRTDYSSESTSRNLYNEGYWRHN
ncbi:hypothetical protein [Helicovermis profundi]|uniref:Uncharacterized protein n=1 Tax=Helicovermis profundi TaxID=3065157 RepID=A0AAU9EMH6_9FIRM|nr:hypothetical protein HLPR_16400 [Clostridia bacterium S502]